MNRYPIAEMAEAALDGLDGVLPEPGDLEGAELVLERVGDALRAGVALPPHITRWMRSVHFERLDAVASRGCQALEDVGVPHSAQFEEALEHAVVTRDRTESVLVGLRRVCIAQGRAPHELGALARLADAQKSFDGSLGKHVNRRDVELALGIRRGLHAGASWTVGYAEPEAIEGVALEEVELPPVAVEPPTDAVVAYVEDGRCAAWVEGYAASSPDFAETLGATIDVFAEAGERRSFVARRWRAKQPMVRYGLDRAEAASSEPTDAAPVGIRLGRLAPTEADAQITVANRRIAIRVYAAVDSLVEITFGGEVVASKGDGSWSHELAWTSDPLRLVVVDGEGRRFEGKIALNPGPEAE